MTTTSSVGHVNLGVMFTFSRAFQSGVLSPAAVTRSSENTTLENSIKISNASPTSPVQTISASAPDNKNNADNDGDNNEPTTIKDKMPLIITITIRTASDRRCGRPREILVARLLAYMNPTCTQADAHAHTETMAI